MKQILSPRFAGTSRLLLMGLGLSLLLCGCDEKLPEPTTKGANTFACKLNANHGLLMQAAAFRAINYLYYMR